MRSRSPVILAAVVALLALIFAVWGFFGGSFLGSSSVPGARQREAAGPRGAVALLKDRPLSHGGSGQAEQNVSPYQLKEWLGHAKLDTTMQYVHLAKGPKAQKVMEGTSL